MSHTYTVELKQQALFLRVLHGVSEDVIHHAHTASRAMLNAATAVGEGQGHIVDFSSSPTDKYREALVRRAALLSMVNHYDIEQAPLTAAAQGEPGAWFDHL